MNWKQMWRWFLGTLLSGIVTLVAAAPVCTMYYSPNPIPAAGSPPPVYILASCSSDTVRVTFRDSLGDVLTDSAAPFEVYIWAGANPTPDSRYYRYEAYACSATPGACSTSELTLLQLGVGQPPPPPTCTAYADPANLPAAGGSVLLQAACSGSTVGTVTWRESGTVLGQASTPPYAMTTAVPANASASARTLTYQLTACVVNSSSCSTSSVTVTQAAATAPPPAVPVCALTATPASLPAAGGSLTLTATCTGTVGSAQWTNSSGQSLGQPATAPYSVTTSLAANSGVARSVSFGFTACAIAAGTACSSSSVTVTQAAATAPPPPVPAPVCAAAVTPASLPATGGLATLSAICSGTAVATGVWRDSQGAVLGQVSTPPYQAVTTVAANGNPAPASVGFVFIACATGGNPCSTGTVTVTVAAATGSASSAPVCTAQATPAALTASGGSVSFTAACTPTTLVAAWYGPAGESLPTGANAPWPAQATVAAWTGTAPRALAYRFTACAAAAPSECSTTHVAVTQAAAAAPPSAGGCAVSAPVVTQSRSCGLGFLGNVVERQVFACTAGFWQGTAEWQVVQGGCQLAASASPIAAVEYYHAQFDHYFVTAAAAEIVALDGGQFAGWQRTGARWAVTPASASVPATAAAAVCRFYGNPAYGLDSHFYSATQAECAAVQQKWPEQWRLEATNVFQVVTASNGRCPTGMTPVVRFYNNRADVNHRYVVDGAQQAAMRARGWVEEGVVFCAQ